MGGKWENVDIWFALSMEKFSFVVGLKSGCISHTRYQPEVRIT
jgi:hypothetical protein